MKVILMTTVPFVKAVTPSVFVEVDYYNHPGHHKSVYPSPAVLAEWKRLTKGENVTDFGDYVFAGYTEVHEGLLYMSSGGNLSWCRNTTKGTEVGYCGRRHGKNIRRVINDEVFNGFRDTTPVVYESGEPNWHWDETRDDACLRITGKSVNDWAAVNINHRARQLAATDADTKMSNWLITL